MSTSTLCAGCEKEGTVRCGGCKKIGVVTRYCSVECQKVLWKTHKFHCGKNHGLFFYPDVTAEELSELAGLLIIAETEKDPDSGNSPIMEACYTFSNAIVEILEALPAIAVEDIKTSYYDANSHLSEELQSINNYSVRAQLSALLRRREDLSGFLLDTYGNMIDMDAELIEENPNQWFSSSSDYNFLMLNYFTIVNAYGFADKNTDVMTTPRAQSVCSRILKEGDKLRREGNLKYFEGGHQMFVESWGTFLQH